MVIFIRLYGPLEKYGSQPGLHQLEIVQPLTLEELLEQLEVPGSVTGFIAVNGIKKTLQYRLKENDVVKVFPIVAGG